MSLSDKTGEVTPKEAHECLVRFCNSHFDKSDKEHARCTIPADPQRDDDLRLSAFIDQAELAMKERDALRSRVAQYELRMHGDHSGNCPFCDLQRGTGEIQTNPICHLCKTESDREYYIDENKSLRARVSELDRIKDYLGDVPDDDQLGDDVMCKIVTLKARVAELEEVVAKLPHTADRVLITSTRDVYLPAFYAGKVIRCAVAAFGSIATAYDSESMFEVRKCFSTIEAAEAFIPSSPKGGEA